MFEFIQQQSPLFVNKLYGNTDQKKDCPQAAWVCRGVLQSLCPLAKCYVMRLLFIEAAISSVDIFRWCEDDQRAAHDSAIKELRNLHIFSEVDIPKGVEVQKNEQWFVLNQYFRNSIKFSMVHLSQPWQEISSTVVSAAVQAPHLKTESKSVTTPMSIDQGETNDQDKMEEENPLSFTELEEYSYSRWNTILEFLVSGILLCDEFLTVSFRYAVLHCWDVLYINIAIPYGVCYVVVCCANNVSCTHNVCLYWYDY